MASRYFATKISSLALMAALSACSASDTALPSPCPNVFQYEPPGTEPGRWYGVVNLSTDSTLHSLWLNIVLDTKADILGNWVGDVTTTNNKDFKIENTKMKLQPGPATAVRFFVQYNALNKPPKLQAIRLNGREICNANNPLPAVDRPDETSTTHPRPTSRPRPQDTRPIDSRPQDTRPQDSSPQDTRPQDTRPQDSTYIVDDIRPKDTKQVIRPEDRPQTRPVQGRPSGEGLVYSPTQNPTRDQSNANPYSIDGGEIPAQNVGTQTGRPEYNYRLTTARPLRTTTQRRDEDDYGDKKPDPDDYFTGGQPTFILPLKPGTGGILSSNNRDQGECGRVLRNNPNPLVVNGKSTLEGQWPWQIALYQTQTVDNKYICGGTLVSRSHVVTAAHCVTRKGSSRVVNKNTLTVYLGKHNLRTSVEGVQIRLVGDISVHPQYNASSFSRDLSILQLRESVQFTDFVRPACLWPENEVDLSNVIGKKGSVVGWGFDEKGIATEELTLVEMPVVDQETCIRSYSEFFARFTSEFTYCAGFRDGLYDANTGTIKSTSVCNGDSGGGMVFPIKGIWYLRGLVSLSVARQNEYRCDPSHYVVFTDLAKFLPWIKQTINNYKK